MNIEFELKKIPAGEFLYGENKEKIYLPQFSIMKYPVTVQQYEIFCKATDRRMPCVPVWGWKDNHPIVNVTWYDASAFARWVGGYLPTEKQWEKAARGTDGRKYPWGDTFDALKCICSNDDVYISTMPVGACPRGASPYGCMDMVGNVSEWCEDYWSLPVNINRIAKGSSWGSIHARSLCTTWRKDIFPHYTYDTNGFRVVMDINRA